MDFICRAAVKAVASLYNTNISAAEINLQETRKEFKGQITIVTFPFTRFSKKSPEQTGQEIGQFLQQEVAEIESFNVIKGFLNISLSDSYWLKLFNSEILAPGFAVAKPNGQKVMVEYSSPNTNKPLHLGHVRNNLLGYSVAAILAAEGFEVIKTNLVNDRGIHICKSMLAWQKFGNGETPQSSGIKGDHLVGKYYVIFDKEHKKQLKEILLKVYNEHVLNFSKADQDAVKIKLKVIDRCLNYRRQMLEYFTPLDVEYLGERFEILLESVYDGNMSLESLVLQFQNSFDKNKTDYLLKIIDGYEEVEKPLKQAEKEISEIAQKYTPLIKEAQKMLQQWEAGNEQVISLWKTMNAWVYEGFNTTYKNLGVDFDKYYYESDTYLLGKDIIEEGLEKGVFFKKDDGSVWIDLTADGLDQKLVLRADGTSVYITQDLGTAQLKYNDFKMDQSIYVVGNEQDYHFKVLFLILKKLGKSWAKGLYHLSYGMVDLPSGKMKSREGTVVDADDLIAEMEMTAKTTTQALGKTADFNEEDKQVLYHMIGMGALKYFLLKVEPKKRLLFDPNESIDFQGHTGPFIQYTHARIRSVLGRAGVDFEESVQLADIDPVERELIVTLSKLPENISMAARDHNPAIIANYVYEVAKTYNKFYHDKSILQAEDETQKKFRLQLSSATANVIKKGMGLLGIDVPERM